MNQQRLEYLARQAGWDIHPSRHFQFTEYGHFILIAAELVTLTEPVAWTLLSTYYHITQVHSELAGCAVLTYAEIIYHVLGMDECPKMAWLDLSWKDTGIPHILPQYNSC